MKKVFPAILILIVLLGCQNSPNVIENQISESERIDTVPQRYFLVEMDSLIRESKMTIRNNDVYDIVSMDTSYCQAFNDLYKDISNSYFKDTPLCTKAMELSVATTFYKESMKEQKPKSSKTKPVKKDWEVKIGCTKEYVLDAWGKPDHIATSESAAGKIEMLYYYDKQYIITIVDGWVEEMSHYE